MAENVFPFKQKDLYEQKNVSTLEKMENLFSVLQCRMEAFNRKTDQKEMLAILSEIHQLQSLLDNLKSQISQEQLELKKAA